MTGLNDYRVTADESSADAPIVALVCEICAQAPGRGDVRWWPKGYSPTIPELVAEAERHHRRQH